MNDDDYDDGSQFTPPVKTEQEIADAERAALTIADKVAEIEKLVKECEELSNLHGLDFGLDIAYGMGGYYSNGEWNASSQSC